MSFPFDKNAVQKKRAEMNDAVMQYYHCYSDQMDYEEQVAQHNVEQNKRKQMGQECQELLAIPAILPPLLVDATVGLGKSSSVPDLVKEAISCGLKVCIAVPNHKLASEYCAKIPAAYHYFGRQSEKQAKGDSQKTKFVCWQKEDADKAASKNHLPAQSICRNCPNAFAHVLENVSGDADRVYEAKQFFKNRKLDAADFKPCQFLYVGLPEALQANVVVITPDSFSDAIGYYRVQDGSKVINEMQRLLIVDEKVNLTKEIDICAGAIQGWLNSVEVLTKRLEETKNNLPLLSLMPEVEKIFKELSVSILMEKEIDKDGILEMHKKVRAIGEVRNGTASWEKISYEDREFFIPLRALQTLSHNLEKGTVRKSKNKNHVYEVSQLVEWAIQKGSTIFLDATSPLAMKELIKAANGQYFDAHVSQNMRVTRFSGHLYSRGNTRLKNYQEKSKNRVKELELIASQLQKPAAIITHKAWLKNSVEHHLSDEAATDAAESFYKRTGVRLGWFGAHDRGHNEWDGFNVAIVGMPLLSPDAIQAAYSGDRTALMTVGADWQEWDGVCSEADWPNCIPPLPVQKEVRAWLLDLYSATIAQAIGRARAVNSERQITIQLYGGLQTSEMDAALGVHGVVVDVTTKDTIHRTREEYLKRGTDIDAIDNAIRLLQLEGRQVSRKTVREVLTQQGLTADDHVINQRLAELRAGGELPPASVGGRPKKPVCDANRNIYDITHRFSEMELIDLAGFVV